MATLGPVAVGLPAADHPVRPDLGRRHGDLLHRAGPEHGRPGGGPLPAGHALRLTVHRGAGGGLRPRDAAGLRQPDPWVHRPHSHHPDRPGPAPGDPCRGRRRGGPGGRSGLGVAGPRPARGLRIRDGVELRGPRDRDLRVAGDRLGAVAHRPAPGDPGVVRPTGPRLACARCAALRCCVRRPVPQVPDHPGGGHLRVGGQLRRRVRRAVAVVVHDDPAPLDPGDLRRPGPPGMPGRRCGRRGGVPRPAGSDLGMGDADGGPPLAPGRAARTQGIPPCVSTWRATGCRSSSP